MQSLCRYVASVLRTGTLALFVCISMVLTLLCSSNSAYAAIGSMRLEKVDTIVSLVTFYPGSEVYELEGHSALRVRTPWSDVAYTWGMFDFNAPHFVYRFVKGETDYSVAAVPWSAFCYGYLQQNRRIVEQELNLTREQTKRLMSALEENMRPENRTYRYNYVLDNCATRPFALIEKAVGKKCSLGFCGDPYVDIMANTYRAVMRHYHKNYPWYQFGIDLALGSGIDQEIDERAKIFAPIVLCGEIGVSRTIEEDTQYIIEDERVLNNVPEDNAILAPTPWYLTPMMATVVLMLISAVTVYYVTRYRRRMRAFYSAFFLLNALVGSVLAFLVFASEHYATSPNWLLLWLNPVAFVPAVTVWMPRADRITLMYMVLNYLALIVMCVAWIFIDQVANAAFWPWIIADAMLTFAWMWRDKRIEVANQTTPEKQKK